MCSFILGPLSKGTRYATPTDVTLPSLGRQRKPLKRKYQTWLRLSYTPLPTYVCLSVRLTPLTDCDRLDTDWRSTDISNVIGNDVSIFKTTSPILSLRSQGQVLAAPNMRGSCARCARYFFFFFSLSSFVKVVQTWGKMASPDPHPPTNQK